MPPFLEWNYIFLCIADWCNHSPRDKCDSIVHLSPKVAVLSYKGREQPLDSSQARITVYPNPPVHEWGRRCLPVLTSSSPPPLQSSCRCLGSDLEAQRTYKEWGHIKREEDGRRQVRLGDGLTRHLCFGSLVVDRLAGQGVDSDLGDGHRGVFQLAVEPQDLSPLTGVLHHLDADKKKNRHERVSGFELNKWVWIREFLPHFSQNYASLGAGHVKYDAFVQMVPSGDLLFR